LREREKERERERTLKIFINFIHLSQNLLIELKATLLQFFFFSYENERQ